MTVYLSQPMVGFDTETTGINVETDRVVTACVALLRPNQPTWEQQVDSWLVNPGVDIPQEATDVHGITTVFAKEHGQDPAVALDEIANKLALFQQGHIPIVGHNLAYDLTLLDRELRRHGLTTVDERLGRPIAPVLDAFVLDKQLDPYRSGGRKLEQVCAHYGVRLEGAHSSTGDALAAARVVYRIGLLALKPRGELLSRYRDRRKPGDVADAFHVLARMNLAELHQAQIGWRQEQCDSLREYFDRKGIEHDGVPGSWPVHPWTQTDEAVLADA